MKKSKSTVSAENVVFICLICALVFIKSYSFYSHLSLASFPPVFAAATTGIVLIFYSLLSLISAKIAHTATMVLYTVMCVVMAVDSVYYSYASKLPSVGLLSMAWQIGGVSDTVIDLIKPRHIMLVIDLPLWLLRWINQSSLKKKFKSLDRAVSRKVYYIVSCALLCVSGVFIAVFPNFEPEYISNELFCYHTIDLCDTLSDAVSDYEVDKSEYTSPDWSGSRYYGLAEGRNVIIIQVEAMQNFVIGAEYEGQVITPNLNALIENDTVYFDNYYYQIGGGNTADAEFAVNNSLFAPESEAAYVKYTDNDYHGLPYLLKDNGYSGAHVFHGYTETFWNRKTAYVNQGFDDFTALEQLEETDMFPMGLSDREMFRQSLELVKAYEEPFYAFYITVSSHYPYAIPDKDREITLKPEDEGTLFGCYIQAMNYVDRALGEFFDELKECGLYDNSVIVIYGDHYALTNTDSANTTRFKEMLGRNYTIYDVFNVPLIINIPSSGVSETNHIAGGHMDTLPTLLCLLGINNDKTVMFGQNLLEAESGFVCEQTHLAVGSFISDEVFFSKPHNNIKSNYDAYEKGTMVQLDPDLFREQSDEAEKKIRDCEILLTQNNIMLE